MPKHVFVKHETLNDNIVIYYDEPAFVVTADRSDMAKLGSLEESRKPGIYVLVGDNKRYVGQASGEILSRLIRHNENKDWWHSLIFFGREDSHLNKRYAI